MFLSSTFQYSHATRTCVFTAWLLRPLVGTCPLSILSTPGPFPVHHTLQNALFFFFFFLRESKYRDSEFPSLRYIRFDGVFNSDKGIIDKLEGTASLKAQELCLVSLTMYRSQVITLYFSGSSLLSLTGMTIWKSPEHYGGCSTSNVLPLLSGAHFVPSSEASLSHGPSTFTRVGGMERPRCGPAARLR